MDQGLYVTRLVIETADTGRVTVAEYSNYMRRGRNYGSTIELWAWAAMLGVRVDVVVAQFSVLGTLTGWAADPHHAIVPLMHHTILPTSLQGIFGSFHVLVQHQAQPFLHFTQAVAATSHTIATPIAVGWA